MSIITSQRLAALSGKTLAMQDRYAGDVGDFLKYGLLRWLTSSGDAPLSLGVVWYLTPDESHNADGMHLSYLESGHPSYDRLRRLDPDLHDRMGVVVSNGRSVQAIERSGALPPGTATFSRPLTFVDLPVTDRVARLGRRKAWLDDALSATLGCDLVFADPDNGIRRADHGTPHHRNRSEKHAYLDELAAFSARGQSIVVYHHCDRSAKVPEQAQLRLDDLGTAVEKPIAAVRASRGTTRLFLVAGAGTVATRLVERLRDLERSPWAKELSVIWHVDPAARASSRPAPALERFQAFSEECLRLVGEVAAAWDEIATIAEARPNRIVEILPDGVLVHTDKSSSTGGSPQLVPAWTIEVAWEHLRRCGTLSQEVLVSDDGLGVKRSAFVMALLSKFPGVGVRSTSPSVLKFMVQPCVV
jgi:hypothetical protein